jgi:hypothetical protein
VVTTEEKKEQDKREGKKVRRVKIITKDVPITWGTKISELSSKLYQQFVNERPRNFVNNGVAPSNKRTEKPSYEDQMLRYRAEMDQYQTTDTLFYIDASHALVSLNDQEICINNTLREKVRTALSAIKDNETRASMTMVKIALPQSVFDKKNETIGQLSKKLVNLLEKKFGTTGIETTKKSYFITEAEGEAEAKKQKQEQEPNDPKTKASGGSGGLPATNETSFEDPFKQHAQEEQKQQTGQKEKAKTTAEQNTQKIDTRISDLLEKLKSTYQLMETGDKTLDNSFTSDFHLFYQLNNFDEMIKAQFIDPEYQSRYTTDRKIRVSIVVVPDRGHSTNCCCYKNEDPVAKDLTKVMSEKDDLSFRLYCTNERREIFSHLVTAYEQKSATINTAFSEDEEKSSYNSNQSVPNKGKIITLSDSPTWKKSTWPDKQSSTISLDADADAETGAKKGSNPAGQSQLRSGKHSRPPTPTSHNSLFSIYTQNMRSTGEGEQSQGGSADTENIGAEEKKSYDATAHNSTGQGKLDNSVPISIVLPTRKLLESLCPETEEDTPPMLKKFLRGLGSSQ